MDDHGDILSHLCEQNGRFRAHLDYHVRNIAQEAVEANTTVLRAELERLGEIVERSPISADSTDVLKTDISLFDWRISCLETGFDTLKSLVDDLCMKLEPSPLPQQSVSPSLYSEAPIFVAQTEQ